MYQVLYSEPQYEQPITPKELLNKLVDGRSAHFLFRDMTRGIVEKYNSEYCVTIYQSKTNLFPFL